ncbi:MAG: 1-deoxy-D-xylulose-5-phosphate synthase [Candidatus Marinimicrobia bacterium]|nr:1-deoxy-D-xylulose-5-phosphate synthase [Candidatus Neomarinimicrobiota bacterium]|tara:strand:+ start:19020 stop:20888 length:1869 start_codon:yes stop_codon:yes gene_type:complete
MNNKDYKILSKINNPNDLKGLSIGDLKLLSDDVSNYIHDVISKLGGHYSSPLGVIELTIALHYVYDTPNDKIVWDVGHQAYAHKILTERRDAFSKIRQFKEISGFLKIDESLYDCYGAGHTSTSISAALGFAHMRDIEKKKHNVLAVIGDGAMTGGLAYEGLNNLGYHRTQLTVVLNDNSLSISESVGALSKALTKITTNPIYNKLRDNIWDVSGKVPVISKYIRTALKKTEEGMKATFTPGGFFEELGIRYIGPIDGHNIGELIKVFESIKSIEGPVLLHVYTNKAKRIKDFGSDDAVKYYSLSPKGSTNKENTYTFSNVFGKSMLNLADNNNFLCVTAAMKVGTGLAEFAKKYKDRHIDVAIAEQHALTYASGISAAGGVPVIAIYSTFIQRAYDQIIHDIALQKLPAVICLDRSGLVGADGPTHHGVFDIPFLRAIPNIIVTSPKDGFELHDLLYTAIKSRKIFSIRYGKIDTNYSDDYKPKLLNIGSWEYLIKGDSIILLAVGSMVESALEISSLFRNNDNLNISVVNCRFVKPLDYKMLDEINSKYSFIYTIEEGNISGGFGSSVLEYFSQKKYNSYVKLFGIRDEFIDHGSRMELLDSIGLSSQKMYEVIKEEYEK